MLVVDIHFGSRRVGAQFSLAPGAQLLLLGPSGAGKSSVLHAIAGLHLPNAGDRTGADRVDIKWGEAFWSTVTDAVQVPAEQRAVAMAFQTANLFPHLSVIENVRYGLVRNLSAERKAELAMRALQYVEAEALRARRPSELSGGERMRVGLARALARAWSLTKPLVLLDEPLTGLEQALAMRIAERVQLALREHGATQIIATHHAALHRARPHAPPIIGAEQDQEITLPNRQYDDAIPGTQN